MIQRTAMAGDSSFCLPIHRFQNITWFLPDSLSMNRIIFYHKVIKEKLITIGAPGSLIEFFILCLSGRSQTEYSKLDSDSPVIACRSLFVCWASAFSSINHLYIAYIEQQLVLLYFPFEFEDECIELCLWAFSWPNSMPNRSLIDLQPIELQKFHI